MRKIALILVALFISACGNDSVDTVTNAVYVDPPVQPLPVISIHTNAPTHRIVDGFCEVRWFVRTDQDAKVLFNVTSVGPFPNRAHPRFDNIYEWNALNGNRTIVASELYVVVRRFPVSGTDSVDAVFWLFLEDGSYHGHRTRCVR